MAKLNFNPIKSKRKKKKEEEIKNEVENIEGVQEETEPQTEIKENKESTIIDVEKVKTVTVAQQNSNKPQYPLNTPLPEKSPEEGVYINGELSLYFDTVIRKESVNKCISLLKNLIKEAIDVNLSSPIPRETYITLFINSPGGSVIDGFRLIDFIEKSPIPIYTVVHGMAASMAVPLALSGKKKFAYKHSVYLIHQLSTAISGKIEDIRDYFKLAEDLEGMLKDYIMEKSKINKKTMDELYVRESWLKAQEALKLGLIDEIIS